MALTKLESILAVGLELFPISKGNQALVFMQMESESQQKEMIWFLAEHEKATEQEILDAAKRIVENSAES